MRISKDLETGVYFQIEREGRANRYQLKSQAALRRHDTRDIVVSDLWQVLIGEM